jgi:protoheme IX farnesyltransferase
MSRIPPEITVAAAAAASAPIEVEIETPGWFGDFMVLTKARLSALVMVTTCVGFCLGSGEAFDWFLLFRVLFGTAFVTASAAILNQVIERKVDRLMARTKNRPLPSGRMRTGTALGLGVLLAVAGFIYLFDRVNSLAAYLSALTLGVYVLLYTPLKRRTAWCVAIGGISGAIPPLIGWAGAQNSLDAGAWILFGVLFCWQMPHFLSIAWMYRDEYAQAGFFMLRCNDIGGQKTARESLLYTLALVVITFLPVLWKMASPAYLVGAVLCNVVLLACAARFLTHRDRASARRLFFASIIYLPLLLGLMVCTKAG